MQSDMFRTSYGEVFEGDERWNGARRADRRPLRVGRRLDLRAPAAVLRGHAGRARADRRTSTGARVLAMLGDSVTTDHISPAGSIKKDEPGGRVPASSTASSSRDFNSYGARRGNHEVMMRGTFANIRLRNQLAPGTEGGVTRHLPDGEEMSIYDAAMRYAEEGVAARRARRQGVRLGLVARLGGEGHAAARRARGDRRELRAHPPLEPRRHGRAAAAVPRGRERRVARASPARRCSRSRAWPSRSTPATRRRRRCTVQRRRRRVRGARADRHAEGGGVLPPRRDPASTCCASCSRS